MQSVSHKRGLLETIIVFSVDAMDVTAVVIPQALADQLNHDMLVVKEKPLVDACGHQRKRRPAGGVAKELATGCLVSNCLPRTSTPTKTQSLQKETLLQ